MHSTRTTTLSASTASQTGAELLLEKLRDAVSQEAAASLIEFGQAILDLPATYASAADAQVAAAQSAIAARGFLDAIADGSISAAHLPVTLPPILALAVERARLNGRPINLS